MLLSIKRCDVTLKYLQYLKLVTNATHWNDSFCINFGIKEAAKRFFSATANSPMKMLYQCVQIWIDHSQLVVIACSVRWKQLQVISLHALRQPCIISPRTPPPMCPTLWSFSNEYSPRIIEKSVSYQLYTVKHVLRLQPTGVFYWEYKYIEM